MFRISLLLSFLPLFLPLLLSLPLWADEIILRPGESKTLLSKGQAWVEKSKIIRLQEVQRGFIIKAVRPGVSSLRLGQKIYEVSVLSPAQQRAWAQLAKPIAKSLNLNLILKDGQVRVQGRLLRWIDWENLYQACQKHDCEYVMEVSMKDSLRLVSHKKIARIFQQHGLPPQNLSFDHQVQALASTKGEISQQVTRLLKSFGVKVIASSSNLDLEPLIKVQITVAEVRKSETLKFGIKWPESYAAQIMPKYAGDGIANIDLHFLETQGLAKVLASPNIICRSGKEASFFAGGEFPIKILNYKVQDVVWKKYGIALNVKPKADFTGKMSISIQTEVSSIDKSMTIDGLPAMFSNRIQSHFDLNESRLIALSGLIKSDQSENAQGLPGLSRLPILGSLFSSKEFMDNRTELVVFVKPEVISPGSLEASK